MSENTQEQIHPEDGYEKSDVNARAILVSTLVGIILIVASLVLVDEYFIQGREQFYTEAVLKPESAPLRDLRTKEAEFLNGYAVIDAKKGVYQIPITVAMERLAAEAFEKTQTKKDGKISKK